MAQMTAVDTCFGSKTRNSVDASEGISGIVATSQTLGKRGFSLEMRTDGRSIKNLLLLMVEGSQNSGLWSTSKAGKLK